VTITRMGKISKRLYLLKQSGYFFFLLSRMFSLDDNGSGKVAPVSPLAIDVRSKLSARGEFAGNGGTNANSAGAGIAAGGMTKRPSWSFTAALGLNNNTPPPASNPYKSCTDSGSLSARDYYSASMQSSANSSARAPFSARGSSSDGQNSPTANISNRVRASSNSTSSSSSGFILPPIHTSNHSTPMVSPLLSPNTKKGSSSSSAATTVSALSASVSAAMNSGILSVSLQSGFCTVSSVIGRRQDSTRINCIPRFFMNTSSTATVSSLSKSGSNNSSSSSSTSSGHYVGLHHIPALQVKPKEHRPSGEYNYVAMFELFDGFNGDHAAQYFHANLHANIVQQANFDVNLPGAISQACLELDSKYMVCQCTAL
jgi:hypothetical protein